uniref:NADH-ubiquinone oxidoreductase chain 4L n=1 Tax=Porichthys myriaster TaxID=262771 RepID=Q5GM85_9TELE|nr:NADH dehydrogenase subunit 4L [Porichthys myriaster]
MLLQQLIFSVIFYLALVGLTVHRTHFLSMLLCLEMIMLILFITISIWASNQNSLMMAPMPLLLLTFSACEMATGLALLVATARTHATDHLTSLNILQC